MAHLLIGVAREHIENNATKRPQVLIERIDSAP